MNSTLTKGTPVISLDTGVTLGKIESLYLDCDARRLVAFSFSSGGILSSKRGHVVEIDDVHAIGPDAVTLDDARTVHDLVLVDGKVQHLVDLDQVVKRGVMTDTGVDFGRIFGLDFDPETFRLQRLRVKDKIGEERSVDGGDVVAIGEEVIVVQDPATAASRTAAVTMPAPTPMDRARHGVDVRRAG